MFEFFIIMGFSLSLVLLIHTLVRFSTCVVYGYESDIAPETFFIKKLERKLCKYSQAKHSLFKLLQLTILILVFSGMLLLLENTF